MFIDKLLWHGRFPLRDLCSESESPPGPVSSCPVWSAFANCCSHALLTALTQSYLKTFFFFWHGLHGNLLIETVMDAVRGGYFLLRALARGLISSHSAIVSGCVRLDNLFHCFELPFHHLYKHLQSIVSSASREHCVKWNLWSQLLLTLGPTGFHKQENTK